MRAVRDRAHARPPRTAPLALILTLGVLAAAVVVADAMVVVSMRGRTARFDAPLHIYPVKGTIGGLCPPNTAGINGQSPSGPACFQVDAGLSIRRVNDIHVEPTPDGRNQISISLLPADKRAFADFTRSLTGRIVLFVVRDRVLTTPRVEAPITQGKILIAGGFSRPDADRLVRELTGAE
ncbi:MAG: SecDF P1 head subdomain-containing protein [Actinomadura sp.]